MKSGSKTPNAVIASLEGSGGVNDVRLVTDPRERDYRQRTGYRNAALALLEAVANDPFPAGEALIYPGLFCFRHYAELQLKHLGDSAARLYRARTGRQNTHALTHLWQHTLETLRHIQHEVTGDVSDVNAYIHFMAQVDPGSQAFRYALGNTGDSLVADEIRLDPAKLLIFASEVVAVLDGIEMVFDAHEDHLREMFEAYGDQG